MKKTIFLTLILALLLTSCGNTNTDPTAGTGNGTQFDPNSQELPLSTKLAIGTLKLEGTEFAVTSDQAASLLPLWQVLNNLSSSDAAAPEEITAITEQIQETMTSEQMQAISDMGLTGQDIFATTQELDIEFGSGESRSEGFGEGQNPPSGGGFPPGGGPPGGGPAGGGGPEGGFGGEGLNPEQIATAQARRAEGGGVGFGNRLMTPLVEAVIELLESKVQ